MGTLNRPSVTSSRAITSWSSSTRPIMGQLVHGPVGAMGQLVPPIMGQLVPPMKHYRTDQPGTGVQSGTGKGDGGRLSKWRRFNPPYLPILPPSLFLACSGRICCLETESTFAEGDLGNVMERKKLTVGGVGLKRGWIVNSQKAMLSLAAEIHPYLVEPNFLEDAPFKTISFIFQYGDKYSLQPEIEDVDTKHSELPVSAEVSMDELRVLPVEDVKRAFSSVLIPALREVADRFKLPTAGIDRYCNERGLKM